MPELPEVQTVVASLAPHVTGRRIIRVDLMRTDIVRPCDCDLPERLCGQTIESVERRAKRIVFSLSDGNRFYIHLGMTGNLIFARPAAERARHTHLVLALPGGEVRFSDPRRFGGVFWMGTSSDDDALGPEPLTLRPVQLYRRLQCTTRAVKTALLDQRLIAGIGNIYADEALFAARIHPQTPACDVTPAEALRLNRAIKLVLRRAIRHRGSTLRDYRDANGEGGRAQRLHRVYDREGKPCPACRTPIARIVLQGRSTHFCPKCQR
jgi:formamidopyrimidine-DNA glycosylase